MERCLSIGFFCFRKDGFFVLLNCNILQQFLMVNFLIKIQKKDCSIKEQSDKFLLENETPHGWGVRTFILKMQSRVDGNREENQCENPMSPQANLAHALHRFGTIKSVQGSAMHRCRTKKACEKHDNTNAKCDNE